MKLGERRPALLTITENIEMKLFSSEEACEVTTAPAKKEEPRLQQRHLEHPLVPDCEDEEPEPQVQNPPRKQTKPKTTSPAKAELCRPVLGYVEETEIEMEVFPPLRVSETELVDIKSDDSSIMSPQSPNKASRLKWKRLTQQRTGLVVKDVVCLTRRHHVAQLESYTVPRGREQAALAAMRMTARITIDYGWSANQMESRLATLFVKRAGQKFSFTYLQCVPGSRVLFVPDTPAEGWTGEQVLRTFGQGTLYIVSHQDYQQAESEEATSDTPVVNSWNEFCLETITESCPDEDNQMERQSEPCVPGPTEELESEEAASETPVVNSWNEFCLETITESCPDEDNQMERQSEPCVPGPTEEENAEQRFGSTDGGADGVPVVMIVSGPSSKATDERKVVDLQQGQEPLQQSSGESDDTIILDPTPAVVDQDMSIPELTRTDSVIVESEEAASETPVVNSWNEFCLETITESCPDEDNQMERQSEPCVPGPTEELESEEAASETPVVNSWNEFCLETITESCPDEDNQMERQSEPCVPGPTEELESEEAASETPVVNSWNEFCLETITESCPDEDNQMERQSEPCVPGPTEEFTLNLDSILRLFRQENLDPDIETHIQVRRRDLLHSALKAVRSSGFCFRTTPIVSFRGEETVGHDGPLREFFRLTLLELQQSSVFEGPPGRLFLTYDLEALEDRMYFEAGVLIGWSLAQGGPGPRCLHPALYQLMCGKNPSLEDFNWRDIIDAEVQIQLQQLHSCTDVKLLSPSLCDWVSSCGIPGVYSAHSDEIPSIYSRLVKHFIYYRVTSMISQFTDGINSCGGLWDTVQSHWEEFVPVMTSAQQRPLTLEEFKRLFTVCYSHPDSQLRAAEEATAGHWETVLTLVNDGQADFSFEDLLAFITGADHLPPLGFPGLISLCFYSQDESMSGVRLPHASTCSLELFLPRGAAGASDLLALQSRAVHEALGFTRFQAEGDGEDRCIDVEISL